MRTVDLREAESTLSGLVGAIESGVEDEIVIARKGKPVARLVAVGNVSASRRLGVAKGRFSIPADIDSGNGDISGLLSKE
jgi:antitoxin (DNA-binding transcriptional repressor) of toxin-antitoxin stability system